MPLGGFLLLAGFYIVTSPVNRTEADDAFWYAWEVETAPWSALLHPHHMLYLPLARVLWMIVSIVPVADRAYPVLAVAGATIAAGAVLVAWDTLVRRLNMERLRAAVAVGLLAFSYGFWRYSAEVEVYALALLWCAAIVNLTLAARSSRVDLVALVFLGATAPLVHILTIPLVSAAVPVAIAIRRGLKSAVTYVVVVACVGIAFAISGYLLAGSPTGDLLDFYAGEKSAAKASVARRNLSGDVVAAGHAVVSGNFVLTYPTVRERIAHRFPDRMLADEIFAGDHAPGAIRFMAPVTLTVLLIALTGFLCSGSLQFDTSERLAAIALTGVWLCLYLGLGLPFSRAGNLEFWILPLLPAWLLLMCLTMPATGRLWPAAALLISLFVHNLIAGLWVYDNSTGDRGLQKGKWLIENSVPGDAILTADGSSFFRYLRYQASGAVFDLQGRDSVELSNIRTQAFNASGSVFATADVFQPPAYYSVLRPAEAATLRSFGEELRSEFDRIHEDDFGGVWVRSVETKPAAIAIADPRIP